MNPILAATLAVQVDSRVTQYAARGETFIYVLHDQRQVQIPPKTTEG